MQNFNQRVITNLASRARSGRDLPLQVRLLRDGDALPEHLNANIRSHRNRVKFMWASVTAALGADAVIVGHVNLLPIAALVRFLRWRTPILLFVHGDEVWNQPGRRKKRWYERLLLHAVNRIASVSQYTAEVMSKEFGVHTTKFIILPNAVDEIERPSSPRSKSTPIVLTVSRLSLGDRPKNIDQMLRAVAVLKDRLPDVRYEIVGDGALRRELEQLADDLRIRGSVKFLGRLSDSELSMAYQRASVFALPSAKEGFGIVYLEAWLRLLPVLCSSFGAAKEVVSDCADGFVVDHRDTQVIADRLYELLTNTELAGRFGENGRRKVETKYLNDSFQANLNAIIDDLLCDGSSSSIEKNSSTL
ncbi:glycosyltransferase family 4 protein [Bradyrhizobium sp. BRP19]|nr:glycosyltransferase family 4 protein [Bradyrhizobium sp. BRP19]MCA1550696.1 glycosyltransferase family 4 protein [Bradyrhizobium sp. BRP19]